MKGVAGPQRSCDTPKKSIPQIHMINIIPSLLLYDNISCNTNNRLWVKSIVILYYKFIFLVCNSVISLIIPTILNTEY